VKLKSLLPPFLIRPDILTFQDGSQVLSLIFLVILMLMYMALIPYGFSSNEIVCAVRSASTRLVYTMAFAIMCTRSIMLATADTDGLPGWQT
jgi:hypothetical protein